VRLYVLTRHAQSTLNLEGVVNGDPSVGAPLTEQGRQQAVELGIQLSHVPLDLCVHTRFERTEETASVALFGRDGIASSIERLFDDIDVGELEGAPLDAYRAWKHDHPRSEPFPGGESLDDAALRYARGLRALLARPERAVLVVCHEIPVRYALNAAAGSQDLDAPAHAIPNATPYLFDDAALERAAERIEEITPLG